MLDLLARGIVEALCQVTIDLQHKVSAHTIVAGILYVDMPGNSLFLAFLNSFFLLASLWQPRPLGQLFLLFTNHFFEVTAISDLLTIFLATRSGREFGGLSKEQTFQQLEEY